MFSHELLAIKYISRLIQENYNMIQISLKPFRKKIFFWIISAVVICKEENDKLKEKKDL